MKIHGESAKYVVDFGYIMIYIYKYLCVKI